MRFTSFAGTGGRQLARQNGGEVGGSAALAVGAGRGCVCQVVLVAVFEGAVICAGGVMDAPEDGANIGMDARKSGSAPGVKRNQERGGG